MNTRFKQHTHMKHTFHHTFFTHADNQARKRILAHMQMHSHAHTHTDAIWARAAQALKRTRTCKASHDAHEGYEEDQEGDHEQGNLCEMLRFKHTELCKSMFIVWFCGRIWFGQIIWVLFKFHSSTIVLDRPSLSVTMPMRRARQRRAPPTPPSPQPVAGAVGGAPIAAAL